MIKKFAVYSIVCIVFIVNAFFIDQIVRQVIDKHHSEPVVVPLTIDHCIVLLVNLQKLPNIEKERVKAILNHHDSITLTPTTPELQMIANVLDLIFNSDYKNQCKEKVYIQLNVDKKPIFKFIDTKLGGDI